MNLDQIRSRTGVDLVDDALASLTEVDTVFPFERTVGDEIQGVLSAPEAVVEALVAVSRLEALGERRPAWHVGVGLGEIEDLAVKSTRAGRGGAYLAARRAVERAKGSAQEIAVEGATPVQAELAQDSLLLLRAVLTRRSARGFAVLSERARHQTQAETAAALGITQSAVSQALRTAEADAENSARRLCHHHLRRMQEVRC